MTSLAAVPAAPRVQPWAFWSPCWDELIEAALELAGVGPGTRFVDLGCGDGRVLLAAAKRGARVRGVEIDPELAAQARAALAREQVDGEVVCADMFAAELTADVVYAYLTPVILARLVPRLARLHPHARVVTPRFGIPGLRPSAVSGGETACYLYGLPFTRQTAGTPGWSARAILVVAPPNRRMLIPLTFGAQSGRIELHLDGPLQRAAEHAVGPHGDASDTAIPVDLIVRPHSTGSVIAGDIRAQGQPLTIAMVFANSGFGKWTFDENEGPSFQSRLRSAIAEARGAATGAA